jgi:membrane-associated protease RseP (regulator of RpoE activity)
MRNKFFLAAIAAALAIGWTHRVQAQAGIETPEGGAAVEGVGENTPPLLQDPIDAPPLADPTPADDLTPPLDESPAVSPETIPQPPIENTPDPTVTPDPQGAGQLTESVPAERRPALEENLFDPGFQLQANGDAGVTVNSVTTGSVAAQSGLQANDRIISIDGRTFTTADEFRTFAPQLVGRQVPIVIERNGQQQTITVMYPRTSERPTVRTGSGAWLGVYLDENFNGGGARISRIAQGSPAARSELRPGDVVVSMNGQDVYDYGDFIDGVRGLIPNSSAELFVSRNGRNVPVITSVGRLQTAAYRGPTTYREESGSYDRLPPSPDDWSQSNYARSDQRMERLERMIEQLQTEVRDLRNELNRQR